MNKQNSNEELQYDFMAKIEFIKNSLNSTLGSKLHMRIYSEHDIMISGGINPKNNNNEVVFSNRKNGNIYVYSGNEWQFITMKKYTNDGELTKKQLGQKDYQEALKELERIIDIIKKENSPRLVRDEEVIDDTQKILSPGNK